MVWNTFFGMCVYMGFPGGSVVKNPPASTGNAGDSGSIPGSGRSPGGLQSMGSQRVGHN